MADNKREQERAELYKSIWGIANDLRGSVDGWDFKNYVLTTLFYRYISENLAEYINKGERDAGDETFDYSRMSDEDAEGAREGLIRRSRLGYIPRGLPRKCPFAYNICGRDGLLGCRKANMYMQVIM